MAVLVEHGEHGSTAAAPIARDIIHAYYDKKSQREKKQFTVEYKRYEVPANPMVAEVLPKPEGTPRGSTRPKP